ncbi:GCN5-related N-acetyltransferase [Porphyrobacter sp. GA68]|uniref:GCN5-related N-acetyltransferase n=1 Tax=Porphyrobacter sp. GA68 TaxID=2883480 RepID=UPI001D18CF9A|nr:GCN5-related N-acetyltransferase [Porphyrobacter sp. GA68]
MDNQADGLLPRHMACSQREEIVARWFFLTREKMPQLAAERGWPVRFDHCFQRILLDNAVGGVWRDVIPAPAYRNATDAQLLAALALGERVVRGEADLAEMNRRSLAWRKKA